MIFEVCIDSIETALVADQLGVHRVELCTALHVGGLTPSFGLIKSCVEQTQLEVHVMIRHQEGNFVYNDNDIQIMLKDIEAVKEAGAHGVVFGCLTENNSINIEQTKTLTKKAHSLNLTTTFHRAFDFVKNPLEAIKTLIALRVNRILTSGQKNTAIEGINTIKKMVNSSSGQIEIMAGSGVNLSNVMELANTGIDALHFTAHKNTDNTVSLGMGNRTSVDEDKIINIINLFN